MSKINKEGYERKAEWADRRMEDNKSVDTLTEDQHEVLASVCSKRHTLHGHRMAEGLYFLGRTSSDVWNSYLDSPFTGNIGLINQNLIDSGLPVEAYLLNIDKIHGTSYCPQGASRL